MTEIKIGGRTVPLLYTSYEMIAIQKELGCTAFELKDRVFGLKQTDEDDPTSLQMEVATDIEKAEKMATLFRILGNAGLEESGEAGDLTDKWILRHIKPPMLTAYAVVLMAEVIEGNRMEGPGKEETGPVDVNVEEQNAKKQPGN